MRKATNIEHILCDVHELLWLVASGEEKIISADFDRDDDLIVYTENGGERFTWEIGFGEEEEEDD